MSINYAERFERQIEQQFQRELTSADMASNRRYNFIDAQTIRIPTIELSGYKDHARDGSKNRGVVGNTYQAFSLTHDRNIEFYVDEMDVDETNQVLSAANITAVFNQEQAIPELDSFRYSKLYSEFVANGGVVNTETLTEANILQVFDKMMEDMDEAAVPQSGRMLKVTPRVYTMLKNAEKIQRFIDVSGGAKNVNRNVRSLDEVTIVTVPSDRMKTLYDFSEGFTPGEGAKQINMMLYHTSAILAPVKVADIYLWNKGQTPDSAFGYLYQNRMYTDLFVIKAKKDAIAINVEASGVEG
ncbi:capsid protein [Clostridium sp. Cult3]|uniref:capsid protein n=1 Tax=Clostridium sp. Cult3 TaxID=2079004 RepID=UPI001F3A3FFC|nr:capsid protein [Clostridium sp. Cult3]MCF6461491.1 capsid protein [Clostridium sp. Cult3]